MSRLHQVDRLTFTPGLIERIWGGDQLAAQLGLQHPAAKPVGEAWLVADHPVFGSMVSRGPLTGETLHTLLKEDPAGLLGTAARPTEDGRFPLLLKLLDTRKVLSLQVHPDDGQAKKLGETDAGKTEMWHVLRAEPNSEILCGLKTGVTPEAFAKAVKEETVEDLIVHVPAEAGMSVFVPSGTVHAIGGGIVLAEIQQNSDVTYRIFDYGRVDDQGLRRELHIDKGLQVIDFTPHQPSRAKPLTIEDDGHSRSMLAACRFFAAELVTINSHCDRRTEGRSFHILLPLENGLHMGGEPLRTCEAVVVPACVPHFEINGHGTFLDYYVPDLSLDVVQPLRAAGHKAEQIIGLGGGGLRNDLLVHL